MSTKDTDRQSLFHSADMASPLALGLEKLAELIDATDWSKTYTWREIEVLARHMEPFAYERDDSMFREGEIGDTMALIVAGEVKVYKETSTGERQLLATVGKGKTLGEMSLLDGQLRSATAIASVDTTALLITRERFEQLCRSFPALGLKLTRTVANMMSARLRSTSGVLVDYLGD